MILAYLGFAVQNLGYHVAGIFFTDSLEMLIRLTTGRSGRSA
jgi:hypothetical protein